MFVNGQRVEWHVLKDGDEILVGRHSLRFIDTTSAPTGAPADAPSDAETITR